MSSLNCLVKKTLLKISNILQKIILELVELIYFLYKTLISPFLGNRCRFHPSCSDYAIGSFREHGILRGILLSVKRLVRCGPYCEGGEDPVPVVKARKY